MVDGDLPDVSVLVEAARQAMSGAPAPGDPVAADEARRQAASEALDRWAPAIDEVVDLDGAAGFLGKSPDYVQRRRYRARGDGTRDWPEPDVEFGRASRGWKLRTIVVHQATGRRRGQHGSSLAPVPGDVAVYLSVADLAAHFGVAANTVHSWRAKYRPGRSLEDTEREPNCPQPDVIVGKLGHPLSGWRADRLGEWDEWLASMPESKTGGRPRTRLPASASAG